MFEGSRLKVERAKKHIADLDSEITSYLSRKPFALRLKEQAAQCAWIIETKIPIPLQFSLVLGDAIHNMRAALDLLIFEMIGDKAASAEAVFFPFCKDGKSYVSTVTGRQIQLAGKNVLAAINTLEPYQGGDDLLYGIHQLDIADKHRLVLTVALASDVHARDIKALHPKSEIPNDGIYRFMTDRPLVVKRNFVNREMQRAAERDKRITHIESKFQPTFRICLGKGQPFAYAPVIDTVTAGAKRIGEVVEMLIVAYNRK